MIRQMHPWIIYFTTYYITTQLHKFIIFFLEELIATKLYKVFGRYDLIFLEAYRV